MRAKRLPAHGGTSLSMVEPPMDTPRARPGEARLRLLTRRTFDHLAASHGRIDQTFALIRAVDAALARTHRIGLHYADWRLRMDLAADLRLLTRPLG